MAERGEEDLANDLEHAADVPVASAVKWEDIGRLIRLVEATARTRLLTPEEIEACVRQAAALAPGRPDVARDLEQQIRDAARA